MAIKGFLCLLIVLQIITLFLFVSGQDEVFKVPLEIREQNRPHRLVDDAKDPDLVRLKIIQDKFFTIAKNTSIGHEFKSFNQLLSLVDSEAGIELGKLIVNGVMLGFGKKNSNILFMEFLDDFKYRLSPDFADAIIDYKDFIKTIDFKLIPVTIQTLFRKDELGNSLAQIPLGQLVDLVQPEASRYGIDIRSMINGILGKGDSKFPDLVNKLLNNVNVSSVLKGLTSSIMDDDEPSSENAVGVQRKSKQDPRLLLFKPFIAKLLKDYKLDLNPDAVIQVMTPFVGAASDFLNNMLSGNGDKSEMNLAQFAPLLGLLATSGLMDGKSTDGKGPDFMKTVMSMMSGGGGMGNNNMDLASILNIASQFLGPKNSKSKQEESGGMDLSGIAGLVSQMTQNSGMDGGNLLQMAASLLGANAKSKESSSGSEANLDPTKLLELASNLIGNMNPKSDGKSKSSGESAKSKNLFNALGPFILRLQKDDKCHTKIKDAINFAKVILSSKMMSLEDLKRMLPGLIASQTVGTPYSNINIDALMGVFSFSKNDWADFADNLSKDDFRELIISNAVPPATEIVEMVSTDEFQVNQNSLLKEKISEGFALVGLNGRGITIHNFSERLKPLAEMVSKGWDLPISLATLLTPLKNTIKETWSWYTNGVQFARTLPRSELERIVGQSLENDIANSIVEIVSVSKTSKSSSTCLAREICDVIEETSAGHPDSLKLTVMRLASIVYGGIRGYNEKNFQLFLQVTRAASMGSLCEKYFPIKCPEAIPSQKEKAEDKSEERKDSFEHMHEDL